MAEDVEIARFAQRLIELVRDRAIDDCDQLASGRIRGAQGAAWREALSSAHARQAVELLLPDIVDTTLFELLNAVDNGELSLGWRIEDGSWVPLDELGRGEMGGLLMKGAGGWLEAFSRQRHFDHLSGIGLRPTSDTQ